ncbi:MAG: nucleotide sugar dehydrogenase [Nitrospinae bacterium]|nr:nucleotide sugar dehydrogenase [Nitrospinota bacterium]
MFDDLLKRLEDKKESIAVVGLGYVGLPLAVALAGKFLVKGYDNNSGRVERLREGHDETGEVESARLKSANLTFSDKPDVLSEARFIIVTVPTPVDSAKNPDLSPLRSASATIGANIKKGTIVVFESTVYPGVTEDVCAPIIAEKSGLKQSVDFKVGYSPERINPGDKEHTIDKVVKVVSGEDGPTLHTVAGVYNAVIAKIHKAASIKVAEAAKVIENIQRDINIALINELSMIFNLMDLRTRDVLAAAETKWNFHRFYPGLVGGHCIGVDPYYLTWRARELGYESEVILAGRRINEGMGKHVAQQAIKLLLKSGKTLQGAKAGVLGLTFKENVPDLRNSRVPDIINELKDFGVETFVHDPICDKGMAKKEYGVNLVGFDELKELDILVLAVAHEEYVKMGPAALRKSLKGGNGLVIDIKSMFTPGDFGGADYWSL